MPKEEPEKQNGSSISVEDMNRIMQTMTAAQLDMMKTFAGELAMKMNNPEPTPKERMSMLANLAERNKQAEQNEAMKAHKRAHCMPPAQPMMPHRRSGSQWGMFNGTSTIAWMLTTMTERTVTGSRDTGPYAFGVCQWCGTEFKPGDPDYDEALSWGFSQSIGSYAMNTNTGVWHA